MELYSGWAWTAANSVAETSAAQLRSDYAHAGAHLLELRLHPNEHILWLTVALKSARLIKSRAAEGVHLTNLGIAYANLG